MLIVGSLGLKQKQQGFTEIDVLRSRLANSVKPRASLELY